MAYIQITFLQMLNNLHLQPVWFPSGIKREVRNKTGAIPVAVKAALALLKKSKKKLQFLPLFATGKWEGIEVGLKPEDLPTLILFNQLSGERLKVAALLAFTAPYFFTRLHILFFFDASLQGNSGFKYLFAVAGTFCRRTAKRYAAATGKGYN